MSPRPAARDAFDLLQELLQAGQLPSEHRLRARHLLARYRRDGLFPPLQDTVKRFLEEYREGNPLGGEALELVAELESLADDGDASLHVPPPPCDEHPDLLAFGWVPVEDGTMFLCRSCWEGEDGWGRSYGVYACSDDCGTCQDMLHDQADEEE